MYAHHLVKDKEINRLQTHSRRIQKAYLHILIYFCLLWVFTAARGLSLVAAGEGYSVAVRRLLIAVASLVAEHGL